MIKPVSNKMRVAGLPLFALCSALSAAPALAATAQDSGTITITGTIKDSTCKLESTSQNVVMPEVDVSEFGNSAGSTAGKKDFTIDLSGCGTTVSGATISFSGTTASDASLLAIDSGEGKASGVALQILVKDGNTAIDLSNNATLFEIAPGETKKSLPISLQYKSLTTPVVAGQVNATLNFTVAYL